MRHQYPQGLVRTLWQPDSTPQPGTFLPVKELQARNALIVRMTSSNPRLRRRLPGVVFRGAAGAETTRRSVFLGKVADFRPRLPVIYRHRNTSARRAQSFLKVSRIRRAPAPEFRSLLSKLEDGPIIPAESVHNSTAKIN